MSNIGLLDINPVKQALQSRSAPKKKVTDLYHLAHARSRLRAWQK
jgi:hypothetical protein